MNREIVYKGVAICSESELIASYKKLNNVWKVAEVFGMSGQSVHGHLKRLGEMIPMNVFSDEDKEILIREYTAFRDKGLLVELAIRLGRTKQFICRQAKELGLTDRHHIQCENVAILSSKRLKEQIKTIGHPKGMLGKTHSDENKKRMSERFAKMWEDPNSQVNSQEYRQILSDRASKSMAERRVNNPTSVYSNCKKGTIEIGGKVFFARSSWEANIAAYYEFLKSKNEIKDWMHEPETFWFEKIRRGVRSYLPDFKIINHDDSFYFVEVKGWMDAKSKTKIKRMAIYYPSIKLDIIGESRYKGIAKNKSLIPFWGLLDNIQAGGLKAVKICKIDGCDSQVKAKNLCNKHYHQFSKTAA